MKTIQNILIAVVAILLFISGYYISGQMTKLPEGMIVVNKSYLDSLENLKPDTIVRDSIVVKDTIIYRTKPIPVPTPTEDVGIFAYTDSVIHKEKLIAVIQDTIQGTLLSRQFTYFESIIYRYINTPYPVIVEKPKYIEKPNPFSAYIGIFGMGNSVSFLPGIQAGIINRNNDMLGVFYASNFDNEKYIGLSYAKKFDLW